MRYKICGALMMLMLISGGACFAQEANPPKDAATDVIPAKMANGNVVVPAHTVNTATDAEKMAQVQRDQQPAEPAMPADVQAYLDANPNMPMPHIEVDPKIAEALASGRGAEVIDPATFDRFTSEVDAWLNASSKNAEKLSRAESEYLHAHNYTALYVYELTKMAQRNPKYATLLNGGKSVDPKDNPKDNKDKTETPAGNANPATPNNNK